MYGNKKREVDDMAKINNNKWYTDEEYDREYHEEVDVRRCKWHV